MTDETISGIINGQSQDEAGKSNADSTPGVFSQEISTDVSSKSNSSNQEWYISDGVKGEGDAPEGFDPGKHKNLFEAISSQNKSIEDMRKMVSKLPSEVESYSVENADILSEVGLDEDSKSLSDFKNLAKELRIPQDTFNSILGFYAETSKSLIDESNTNIAEYEKKEFEKLGENGKEKVNALNNWASNSLPDDLYDSFKKTMNSADSVKVLDYFRESMVNNNNIPAGSRGASAYESSNSLIQKTRDAMSGKISFSDLTSQYENLYDK